MRKSYMFIALLAIVSICMNAQNRVVRIMQNGGILNSFPVEQIDSIIIDEVIDTPSGFTATVSERSVILTWAEVANATYDVYRSANNITYTVLSAGVTGTRYVDGSPLPGTNYYKIKARTNEGESEFSAPAMATLPASELESGIYLGITGFNQALYEHPIVQLNESSITGLNTFVDGLAMKNGTLLYYSVDQAIKEMQSKELPEDIATVAIVTFTDGLDQGSMMMDVPYVDDMSYLDALNTKIMNETVTGIPITAYSIGIRGQDVADVTMFRNNLTKLASSSENATEVTSMSEVNAKFREIAEQLSQSNYVQTISLKMPGVSNGTLVRFTFDNVNSADKSTLYIEGTFNLSTRSLENVKYVGLKSASGTEIKGVVDGIFVSFTFESVHTDNNKLIDSKFMDEWTYIASNGTWQVNSEFDKTENSDIVTERSSAAIMLVLDCSSSLAGDFAKAQTNAKDFINTLYGAVGGETGSEETPKEDDNTIYSTTPKDLTLAVWKDGKRYYLTKEDYDKANLSDAVVEGLTIVAGGESFILALQDIQSSSYAFESSVISLSEIAMKLYSNIMPTTDQGIIISAKWSDINNAIYKFEGNELDSEYYYCTESSYSIYDTNGYFIDCIHGAGGSLYSTLHGGNEYFCIRGVKSTDYSSAIYWKDPDDLKLSVIINGTREFLDEKEYNERMEEIDVIEGVAIIAGGEKFALHLDNAQTDAIGTVETAMTLYGDIIPTEVQGKIISAKYFEINSALRKFGGSRLYDVDSNRVHFNPYYTSSTVYQSYIYTNCIYRSDGLLYSIYSAPYVRGVTNLK